MFSKNVILKETQVLTFQGPACKELHISLKKRVDEKPSIEGLYQQMVVHMPWNLRDLHTGLPLFP